MRQNLTFRLSFSSIRFIKNPFSIIYNELTVKTSPPTRVNPTPENRYPPIKTEVFTGIALNVEYTNGLDFAVTGFSMLSAEEKSDSQVRNE